MTELIKPPVPELASAKGQTVEELALHFINYHNRPKIPWSYRSGVRTLMSAYSGLHSLPVLLSASEAEKIKQSRICNRQLIELAAPFSFGRETRVMQLPSRKFAFGRDRTAAYRVPFFFVENRTVKLFFVQPRKTDNPCLDELAMIATIHKRYLLDNEFFGQACDVEYIDIGPEVVGEPRVPRKYALRDSVLWSDERLEGRLTLISAALELAEHSGLLAQRARRPPRPSLEMPLFD